MSGNDRVAEIEGRLAAASGFPSAERRVASLALLQNASADLAWAVAEIKRLRAVKPCPRPAAHSPVEYWDMTGVGL